ncbi:amidase [Microvirga sp. KLBC 81]|uniref:amidase n=1 Tax=Microvirga sp. KLBC 81 TaxID=1862707 RepID=UPI000D50C7C8|nr:amidase [Microvirga sp. KLBC 81]PVE22175.1 amidase [Microvirga sp. KLBC 81]
MQPNRLTLTEARAAIAEGSLTSEDLVRACLARIAEREPAVRAFASVNAEGALAEARNADKALLLGDGPLGPLHGIPIGVKDVIDTADLPTEHNSIIYKGFRPGQDAACVAILRAAGAIVLGKTETIEFAAHGRNAVTRNPRDLSRTPGGSSSGSAAAVADQMIPLALGTQTGGSLIRPASFCGIFGMKPTFGTVSTEGAKRFSSSLDTIGWYARSLEDLALITEVFEVSDESLPPPPPLHSVKLAWCRTPYWGRATAGMQAAFEAAVAALQSAGAALTELDLGEAFADVNDLKEWIMRAEGRVAFLNLQRTVPHLLSPGIRARMERTQDRLLLSALDRAALLRMEFDRAAAPFDAVITPAATGIAPEGLSFAGDPIFNGMWTLLHVPCITLPLLEVSGLPMGLQLVGPRYNDGKILAAAATVWGILSSPDFDSLIRR